MIADCLKKNLFKKMNASEEQHHKSYFFKDMTTIQLAKNLCKQDRHFQISNISKTTNSIYIVYTEKKLKYYIRISDHLKNKGNNYFDLNIILDNDKCKLIYCKLDFKYRKI